MNFKVGDKIRLKQHPECTIWEITDIKNFMDGNEIWPHIESRLYLKEYRGRRKGETILSNRFEKIDIENHPHTNIFK